MERKLEIKTVKEIMNEYAEDLDMEWVSKKSLIETLREILKLSTLKIQEKVRKLLEELEEWMRKKEKNLFAKNVKKEAQILASVVLSKYARVFNLKRGIKLDREDKAEIKVWMYKFAL